MDSDKLREAHTLIGDYLRGNYVGHPNPDLLIERAAELLEDAVRGIGEGQDE